MTGVQRIKEFKLSSEKRQSVLSKLEAFKDRKILIVGDIGLDEYLMGDVRRISPEAPVPVLEVTKEDQRLGLSGNVALNIATLTAKPFMVSVVGDDLGAEKLKSLCYHSGVSAEHLLVDQGRPTTRKTRVMSGQHHIVRVDHELKRYISPEMEKRVLQRVGELIDEVEGVILQDYAKGVVTQSLVEDLVRLSKQKQKPLFVDPTRSNPASFYRGADVIKPNYDEAVALSGLKFEELQENPNKIFEVAEQIQLKTQSPNVVITCGAQGMVIFTGKEITRVPTYAKKVFDVTGAGDTVVSALALAQLTGLPLTESAVVANHAAGLVVARVGCVPCDLADLRESLKADIT